MLLILKIAWRNIWRNWRRSILTMLAVVFAVFFIVMMKGIQKGTFDMNIKHTLELFTGYMQIQKEGYQDNPTLNKSFSMDLEMLGSLQSNPYILGFTPRINSFGLIGFGENSVGTAIFGVDPNRELLYSKIASKVKKGSFLNEDYPYDIIIGDKMLKNLGAAIGDSVVILTQALDGSLGNMKFNIVGSFRFGSNELDGMAVFMHISAADELMAMNNKINSISIYINDMKDIPIVTKEINELILKKAGMGITLLLWEELLPDLKQAFDMDVISSYFYVGILVMIVGFGILNTVLMSITERFREFGVMLALGTKHYIIVVSVFIETMILTIMGILAGSGLGYIGNWIIMKNPIALTGDMNKMYEEFGFIPEIHASLNPDMFIMTAIIILIISVLVFIYPAYRMNRLEALKGIRYT